MKRWLVVDPSIAIHVFESERRVPTIFIARFGGGRYSLWKDVVDSSLWEVCWVDRNWHIDGMSAGGGDPVLQFVDHWIA